MTVPNINDQGKIELEIVERIPAHKIQPYADYSLFRAHEPAVGHSGFRAERYLLTREFLFAGDPVKIDFDAELVTLKPNPSFRYNDKPVNVYRPVSALRDSFLVVAEIQDRSGLTMSAAITKNFRFYDGVRETNGLYDGDPMILMSRHHIYGGTSIPLDEALKMNQTDKNGLRVYLHKRAIDNADRLMKVTRDLCRGVG